MYPLLAHVHHRNLTSGIPPGGIAKLAELGRVRRFLSGRVETGVSFVNGISDL
jgi:hypothetical protein